MSKLGSPMTGVHGRPESFDHCVEVGRGGQVRRVIGDDDLAPRIAGLGRPAIDASLGHGIEQVEGGPRVASRGAKSCRTMLASNWRYTAAMWCA